MKTAKNASDTPPSEAGAKSSSFTAPPPATHGSLLVYALGPKGGIGKSLTARLTIDGLIVAGKTVQVVQVDRGPTLPQLYPGAITIDVPDAEGMRADALAAIRAFEPLEEAVSSMTSRDGVIVVDGGSGHFVRALLNFIGRGRFDGFIASKGVRAVALVLLTADPSAMKQSADMIEELVAVHPSAEIVLVFNGRDGQFKFLPNSPAHKVYAERIAPLMAGRRHIALPAIAAGAWPIFEAAGLTFSEAVLAGEKSLVERLGMSRLLVTALQGDVSEFLSVVWPRLGAVLGFDVGGL